MMMPGLRIKAATSRAHGFRRYHQAPMGRSSSDALSRSFDVRLPCCFCQSMSLQVGPFLSWSPECCDLEAETWWCDCCGEHPQYVFLWL